jgi:type II secretory pathway component PulF
MALYQYRAVDENSNIIAGRMSSADENELEKGLAAKGMLLIDAKGVASLNFSTLFTPGFGSKELLDLTYMLKLIVDSGISILIGLNNIISSHGNRGLGLAAEIIHNGVHSGLSISESMQNHPALFPKYYIQVVKAGEISGTLGESLSLLMEYISWGIEFKKNIKGGLVYPVILFSVMSLAMVIIFTFVFPKLITALTVLGGQIPMSTRVVISISDFMRNYILIIIPTFFAFILLSKIVWKTESGRYATDRFILQLPVVGEMVAKINLSRYFKIVATLHSTGVSVRQTFETGAEVVENQLMASKLRNVSKVLLEGKSISQALSGIDHMPVMVLDMIALAERTGDLDGALKRAGDMLDKEVPEKIKKFMAYFEPLTIVLLGGMVLVLLLSIFLPIYKTVGMIRVR